MSETPKSFTSIIRKANKEHRCCECYRLIRKGEHYQYSSGIWSTRLRAFKQCMDCRETLAVCVPDNTLYYKSLRKWLKKHIDQMFINHMVIKQNIPANKLAQILRGPNG